ncbi:MAG TPA: hypothetical protein VJI74_03510 [Candidatus Paceibacterota bacterium]
METQRHRISLLTAAAMLGVAIMIDGIQLILDLLIIGAVFTIPLDVIAWCLFFVWFLLCGVNFWNRGGRNAFAFFGVSAFEIIPFLNALPGWTLAVGLTIFFTRQEDAAYNKRIAPAQA